MQILNYNINVMNEYGVIIGSGDRERIGRIHAGALQVIERKESVNIGISKEERLTGTKPGINLPIVFEEKIVGVIGISGDLEEISQFGELVKMSAEMMLQQAALAEQLQWDVRLREELVNQIVYNQTDLLSEERAKRLNIQLHIKRIPIVIEFIPQTMEEELVSKLKRNILSYLHNNLHQDDLIASTGSTEIVILKNDILQKTEKYLLEEFHLLIEILKYRESINFKVGIGSAYIELEDAHTSYMYAKNALKVGKILYPEQNIYDYEELLLPIHLSYFSMPDNQLLQYYKVLSEYDKNNELQNTLDTYIEENGNLNQTAKKLYIHRNTLSYRLQKIGEVTGKDPRKIKDLLELTLSKLLFTLM